MRDFEEVRQKVKQIVLFKAREITEIVSLTFVGSFEYSDSFSTVSDIDIVIIIDKLNKSLFDRITTSFAQITGEACGLPEYLTKLNTTFGPLKLDSEKTVVFHLMIYDLPSHRKHVNESPFTCYDWESFPSIIGKNLRDIYPVGSLQLSDLVNSRRGLENYLNDIENGRITFRRYVFSESECLEERVSYHLDERHKKEYAYHVMKFVLTNFMKILQQLNFRASDKDLAKMFSTLNPAFSRHTLLFLELSCWKKKAGEEPSHILPRLRDFIEEVGTWAAELMVSLPKIDFFRHGKTALNDGTFLGSRRNPGIIPICKQYDYKHSFDLLITGTLLRTLETAKLFNYTKIEHDPRLNEIDYGLAEGLTIEELRVQFPEVQQQWTNNLDPKFPEGENQKDVLVRLQSFLNNYLSKLPPKTAVITHNIVLRTLIGVANKFPEHKWYLFTAEHLESFSFIVYNNVLIPDISNQNRTMTRDKIVQWKS